VKENDPKTTEDKNEIAEQPDPDKKLPEWAEELATGIGGDTVDILNDPRQ